MTAQQALEGVDVAHFKRRLRERWGTLRDEIRGTLLRADTEQYADIAGEVRDLEDDSLADLLTDVTHAEVGRDVEEVRDIEAALQRIATGAFAVCIRCGQPIDRDRLDAYPTAKRCLACQRLHERSRLSRQGPTL
jgi:RNA polymerase-binding transcription factor DksA